MYIEIHLNSDELTEKDRAILTAIGNAGAPFEVIRETPAEETPKKRAARKPKESALPTEADKERMKEAIEEPPGSPSVFHDEPAPAPEPEEPEVDPKELINDAAERAVKLIRSGKRDEVKAILDRLGLEKVTALKDSPEQVQPFLSAISALED